MLQAVRATQTKQVVIKVTNQDVHRVHVFISRCVLIIRVATIVIKIKRKAVSVQKDSVPAYRVTHPVSREAIAHVPTISREAISLVVAMVSPVKVVINKEDTVLGITSRQRVRKVDTSLVSKVVISLVSRVVISLAVVMDNLVRVVISLVVAMVSPVRVVMVSPVVVTDNPVRVVMVSLVVAITNSVVLMIPMQNIVSRSELNIRRRILIQTSRFV
jgi:hypothetical protein